MERLRIVYSKSKEAAYLLHIDLIRIFEQSFVRAGIVTETSEMYPVKSNLIFADPLPTGVESVGEIAEIMLDEKVDVSYFIREINKVLPNGITILNGKYIDLNEENLLTRVYAATYIVHFIYPEDKMVNKTKAQIDAIKNDYKEKMKEYLTQDNILVLKKSKNRSERIDIKPFIINHDFLIDGALEITLFAGVKNKLSPTKVMQGYREYIGEDIKYSLKRTKIFLNKM